jgi:hypothetical protein
MTELHIAHTADLGADQKTAIRSLMDAVFDGVSDDTFGNALGGVHAMVLSGGELIGHGSVVQRRMLHVGRTLRTGYVEGVAVRADRRQPRGQPPVRLARLAAVARTHLRHDAGRHQAHPGLRRLRLRPAGVGPGRRVRRTHLRLAPGLAVVNRPAAMAVNQHAKVTRGG